MTKICDMLNCNSTHNVQQLSKYIWMCESCWFSVMNGVHKWDELEKEHLTKIENERRGEKDDD